MSYSRQDDDPFPMISDQYKPSNAIPLLLFSIPWFVASGLLLFWTFTTDTPVGPLLPFASVLSIIASILALLDSSIKAVASRLTLNDYFTTNVIGYYAVVSLDSDGKLDYRVEPCNRILAINNKGRYALLIKLGGWFRRKAFISWSMWGDSGRDIFHEPLNGWRLKVVGENRYQVTDPEGNRLITSANTILTILNKMTHPIELSAFTWEILKDEKYRVDKINDLREHNQELKEFLKELAAQIQQASNALAANTRFSSNKSVEARRMGYFLNRLLMRVGNASLGKPAPSLDNLWINAVNDANSDFKKIQTASRGKSQR